MKIHKQNGELQNYLIGFMLSIIFTYIPYDLVVSRTVTGTPLLILIIAIAMIQVVVQITYFLHLGRGPKPNWNIFFFISTVVISLIVVVGAVFIMNQLYLNMLPTEQVKKLVNDENIYQVGGQLTGSCREIGKNHTVTVDKNKVTPKIIEAYQCDTMTYINNGNSKLLITFGEHEHHDIYAGITNIQVRKDKNETIVLSELGSYRFHNHLNDAVSGQFNVVAK